MTAIKLRPRATLFDLDDTLIGRQAAFERTARAFYDTQPVVSESVGWDEANAFFQSLSPLGTIDAQSAARRLNERWPDLALEPKTFEAWFFEMLASHAKPLPGIVDMLTELNERAYPWGVITNGLKFQIRKLEGSGLVELVPFAVVSRLFGADKPDPSIFHAGLTRLQASFDGIDDLTPTEVLMVGDNPYTDILGAQRAGMMTAWVHAEYDYPDDVEPPDVIIVSVTELRPALGLD